MGKNSWKSDELPRQYFITVHGRADSVLDAGTSASGGMERKDPKGAARSEKENGLRAVTRKQNSPVDTLTLKPSITIDQGGRN